MTDPRLPWLRRLVAILNERTANDQMSLAEATALWVQTEYLGPVELALVVEDLEAGS